MTSKIKVLFVAGFGPIVPDQQASEKLYVQTMAMEFEKGPGGYLHTENVDGVKHFALWPLSQAAQSCFGRESWPADLPIPQGWLEMDVEDVAAATEELEAQGYKLLVAARTEPWGQVVTRFLSPEGLLLGLTYTPWMRQSK
jgi:Glyoxalase/Bleomycin resistance protein/Dioxygenase superfamily